MAAVWTRPFEMTLACQAFAVKQWLSGLPDASSVLYGPPIVEMRSAGEGRGLGLYASRSVEAFSPLLVDVPLVLMQPTDDLPELYQHFSRLSDSDQRKYLSLSLSKNRDRDALLQSKLLQRGFDKAALQEMSKVASIMQTNAFNVDLHDGQGSTHRALFARIARINHSCAPNAHVCFYPPLESGSKGRMVVHSLKALHAGDEILISYFKFFLPRSERQAKTQKWGFSCSCPVCSNEETSERDRKSIWNFTTQQTQLMNSQRATMKEISSLQSDARAILESTTHKAELFPALPDLYDGIAMLHAKALLIQKQDNEGPRGELASSLEQAAIWEARITGPDSPATTRRLNKLAQFAAGRSSFARSPKVLRARSGEHVVIWSP